MTTLQLALVLVASIWAAFNTLIAGYNAVNSTRDRILTGRTDEGYPLALEHRRIMYRNDWIPLKTGLAAVSLAFAGFIALLPEFAEDPAALRLICYAGATLPFFAFLGFFILGLSDRRLILRTLAAAERGPDRAAGSPDRHEGLEAAPAGTAQPGD